MNRRADLWSGIVLVAVGLVGIFVVIPWQIGPGPTGYMSPRLVPTAMMAVITVLAALMVVRNLRPAPDEGAQPPVFTRAEVMAALRIGAVFAVALAAYVWISPLVAGTSLVVGALLALGERRPLVLVGMPAGLMLAIWALFYKVLGTAIV